jgi:hypothetical protein
VSQFLHRTYQLHHDTKLIFRLPISKNVMAKIAPWCLACRDSFTAKEPVPVTGLTAPPTLTNYTRCRYSAFFCIDQVSVRMTDPQK